MVKNATEKERKEKEKRRKESSDKWMRRNCSLELRPVPFSDSGHNHREQQAMSVSFLLVSSFFLSVILSESPQERQQLTIFYNGRVCVCYVTELQARAILSLASREMEDKMKTSLLGTPTGRSEFVSPLPSPLCSPSTGLSMKRSIQRFLQKRKHRAQATSPYNY
ncbi:conserved hypothetical protein [Ricinus communis]|uniref:Protein TIFY n=1 Tax=Ricinus communis TaxID=3988 RepID=B9S0Z2_RICCO|nr:conserved hypothetical protein [Ricinus communis]